VTEDAFSGSLSAAKFPRLYSFLPSRARWLHIFGDSLPTLLVVTDGLRTRKTMSLKIAAEKLVPSLARTQLFATSSRAFSVDGMRGFKDRERAAEEIYFKQEEHRMLKKLAEKARLQVRDC